MIPRDFISALVDGERHGLVVAYSARGGYDRQCVCARCGALLLRRLGVRASAARMAEEYRGNSERRNESESPADRRLYLPTKQEEQKPCEACA